MAEKENLIFFNIISFNKKRIGCGGVLQYFFCEKQMEVAVNPSGMFYKSNRPFLCNGGKLEKVYYQMSRIFTVLCAWLWVGVYFLYLTVRTVSAGSPYLRWI